MPKKLIKFKLLLDENMPPRQRFPRLNSRFDLKHVRDDLHYIGLKDPAVFRLAMQLKRLLITFNGVDFKPLLDHNSPTGIINVSANMRNEQIDTKLTALFIKSSAGVLYGQYTDVTGETTT